MDEYAIGSVASGFSLEMGFLPRHEPLRCLPAAYEPWEALARALPDWFSTGLLRKEIAALPAWPQIGLENSMSMHRAMMILSYLGHAYVWDNPEQTPQQLPECLAVAWYDVAQQVGRPPVLSYASYALSNWRKIDPSRPIGLDNIALLQRFLGGVDEAWFILIHVVIESQAIPALQAIVAGLQAVVDDDPQCLLQALTEVGDVLMLIGDTLARMPEHCDPYIYYHRVRPYIHGWSNNPALPQGLLYMGVEAFGNKPVKFKGETGAQSMVIPAVDAFLSIDQEDDLLKVHLTDMLAYAPSAHREFVLFLKEAKGVRKAIVARYKDSSLIAAYNRCVEQLTRFRAIHFEYAIEYIQRQHQHHVSNTNEFGTGGTPFARYLKKHEQSCERFLIGEV